MASEAKSRPIRRMLTSGRSRRPNPCCCGRQASLRFAFHRDLARGELKGVAVLKAEAAGTYELRWMCAAHAPSKSQASSLPATLAHSPVDAPAAAFLQPKTTRGGHLDPFAAGTEAAFDTLMWNLRRDHRVHSRQRELPARVR